MMMFLVIVVLIVISGKVRQHLCLTATFHGSGYASTDWKESSAETHLTFDFLTSRSEAILLIGSGGRDSLVVTLHEGHLLVRVDLGSGEAQLRSPSGLILNDLKWHTVQFSRYYGNVTLIMDGHYSASGKTPGVFGDLNLDGAIFLGGAGSDDALLNSIPSSVTLPVPFRGCIRDVIMNGVNLLAKAKRKDQFKEPMADTAGVTWDNCRPEITSSSDKEIFFPHNNSFVAFPTLNLRVECRVSLEVKVHANRATLMYASGSKVESDFLALEIVMGAVQVKINKGSGLIKLTNKEKRVNDGAWHTVSLQVDTRRIILAVDDAVSEEIISQSGPATWTLDVDEPLFVGGIGAARRILAARQRFDTLPRPRESSLIGGCIRRIYLNDHHFGWKEALDSNNVEPDCPVKQGPCGTKDELTVPSKMPEGPCIKEASCVELDWNRFRCECSLPDWSMCYKKNTAPYVMDRNDGAVDEGIVFEADDVSLVEGGFVTLNSSIITVPRVILLDESLKNLLFFKVVLQPKHGTISKQEDERDGSRHSLDISLDDIFQDRVAYLHDGSETEEDQVGFLADLRDLDQGRIDFQTWLTDGELEEELHRLEKIWPPSMRPQNFSINFRINLVNDPPSTEVVEQLDIIVDTQRTVTRELLNATDPDDPPDKLEWKVFYSYSSQQQVDIGYFEMEDSLSGKIRSRVTRFTQDDVDRGRVRFVHRGTARQNIGLQLSDGKDKSEMKNLVIRAEPQFIRPLFNTGINIVGWGGASLITSANLTFTSNLSPLTSDHIRYEMIDPPRLGFIQRRRIRQSKKRKQRKKQKQQKQQPTTPDYLFDNHDQGRTGREESRPFDLPTGEKRKRKFKGQMVGRSEHQDDEDANHDDDDDDNDDMADWEIVRLFTQAQIDNGLVRYLHYQDPEDDMSQYLEEGDDYPDYPNVDNEFGYPQASGPLHDRFKFKVGVLGRESDEFDFAIRITLPPSLVMVSNGPLIYRLHGNSLPEVAVTPGHLLFSSDDLEPRVEPRDVIYRLMTSPKLGSLFIRADDSTLSDETLRVDSTFTQLQVNQALVAYRLSKFFQAPLSGDDEALTDDFILSVGCEGGAPVEFMFKIIISSRSDSHLSESNGKTGREPDHVIVEEFGEASINTALTDFIVEARAYVENAESEEDMSEGTEIRILELPKYGKLVVLGESSADEQVRDIGISVAEVESSKLVYRHDKGGSSEDMFSFVLIKEGRPFYDVSHVYIGIVPPVMPLHVQPIQVAEGGLTHLNSDHVNVGESHYSKMKVEMLLVVPPKHGRLSMNKSLKEFNQFSLDDIKYGRITYEHDNSETTSDWMMLMARTSLIGKQSKPQLLLVEITPVDDQSPQLVNNRPISIYPGKTINLTGDMLRVEDKDSTPNDVTYDISYYQHFELGRFQKNGSDVTKFTQDEIDANFVTIRISDVLPSPKLHNFPISVSDVSNNRLRIAMDFHVKSVRLEFVSMETVRAFPGVLQPITNDSLKMFISSENMNHLIGQVIIEVTKKPIHGRIVRFKNDQSLVDLDSFGYSLVQSSSVFYISNPENDTSLADSFSFRASLNNEIVQGQIEICTSLENINRQNSHYLLTIQPLEVREGERAKFTKDNLDVSKLVSILKSRRHIRQMESMGKPDKSLEVKLIISNLPVHGWLTLNGENLTERFEEANFLEIRQSDIDGGYLQYQHDDSESLMDFMEISFEMPSDKPAGSTPSCPPLSNAVFRTMEKPSIAESEFHTLSTPLTFHIHITPYNDHHFRLLTSAPRAQVVQNGWVVLDSSVLLAEDLDTPPEQIVYKITDRATNGRLVYVNSANLSISANEFRGGLKVGRNFFSENNVPSVERFSQSDVNEGRIWFLHDGSDFQPGSIYFSLFEDVDKKFLKNQKVESNILYKALKIDVTPLELKILRVQILMLTQGNYALQILPEDFQIMTNTPDPAEDISFEISKNFHHGQLLLEEKAASKFFQRDLQRGSVRYVLTKVDSPSDDALMTISDSSNILLDIQIRVSIRINVALSDTPVQVIQKNGHWFKFNLTHLNASSLAELTGDDPIYRIIEGPTRGKLRKLNKDDLSFILSTRPSDKRLRRKRDVESLWFKHSDVLVGNLEYRPYPSGSRSTLKDGFRFTLEARNVPTAEGKLDMEITPAVAMDQILAESYSTPQHLYPVQSTPESKEGGPDDEEVNDGTMHDASGMNSSVQRSIKDKQNIIIAAVLALLAVLLIVGVFLVKCLCIQRKKLKEESLRQAARAGEASDEMTFRADERMLSHRSDVHYRQPRDDHVSKGFHEPFYDRAQSGGVILPKPDVLRNEGPRTPRNSLKRWSAHEASSHLVPDNLNGKTCRLSTALQTSSFQPQQSMKLTEESLMTLQQQLRQKQTCDQHDPQTCKQYTDWQRTSSGQEGSETSPSTTLAGERRGERASNEEGGSNASSNLALKDKQAFGWSNIDPELLEHCRKTNPVLHKDQYWV